MQTVTPRAALGIRCAQDIGDGHTQVIWEHPDGVRIVCLHVHPRGDVANFIGLQERVLKRGRGHSYWWRTITCAGRRGTLFKRIREHCTSEDSVGRCMLFHGRNGKDNFNGDLYEILMGLPEDFTDLSEVKPCVADAAA